MRGKLVEHSALISFRATKTRVAAFAMLKNIKYLRKKI